MLLSESIYSGRVDRYGTESQKMDDALMRALDSQQTSLKNDTATLQRLQVSAQGSTGQMQANTDKEAIQKTDDNA